MGRRTVALLLALLALPSLAGCFSDLERVRVDTTWEAEGTLHRGPQAILGGIPAQLVLEGPLSVSDDLEVELTGVSASLSVSNRSIALEPARIQIDDRTLVPSSAIDQRIELADGDAVRVGFLPRRAEGVHLGNETNWTVDAELRYRFREGPRFDAGRFSYEANLTPAASPTLGVGVPRIVDDQIASVVFAAVEGEASSSEVDVRVFHVTGDGITRRANRTASLEPGTGVRIGELSSPVGVPEGPGYQLLILGSGDATGVAATPDRPAEQPIPGAGALGLVATALAVAWTRARRRG